MIEPKGNPQPYYKLLHQKRETELFLSALRLNIFSELEVWETAEALAKRTGLNGRNLDLFLNALACIGLLEKSGNTYRNTQESNEFLSKSSPLYLGDCLLFRERSMSPDHLDERVRKGPDLQIAQKNNGVEVYDFCGAARTGISEMYTGRVQSLIKASLQLLSDRPPKKILDLGGGHGVIAIELVLAFPGCRGVVFEHPSVACVPESLIAERRLSERIRVMQGDFNKDDIGGGYDLIIVSGILNFAKDHLDALLSKLCGALNVGGYLYVVAHGVSEDYQSPPETILGWLSGHLDGLDLLLTEKTIDDALFRHGFRWVRENDAGGVFKGRQGKFYEVNPM